MIREDVQNDIISYHKGLLIDLTESTRGCFRTDGKEGTNYIGSVDRLVAGFEEKIVDPVTANRCCSASQLSCKGRSIWN